MSSIPALAATRHTQILLLPAPPQYPQLTAPNIAGLLPASTQHIIIDFPPTHNEILAELGSIRSLDEMNEELRPLVRNIFDSILDWRRSATYNRPPQPPVSAKERLA